MQTTRETQARTPFPPIPGEPVRLRWTDPEDGQELWIEMWGSPEHVADLLRSGFEVGCVGADETASSLCVRIRYGSGALDAAR